MNKRIIKLGGVATFVVTASVAVIVFTGSTSSPRPDTTLAGLSGVPAAELPAAAASLVRHAAPAAREAVAKDVIEATAALMRPGLLPYVVSAICEAAPEVSPAVALASAECQSSEALTSAKAAVAAAPERADQIAFAVAHRFPTLYAPVAAVAAEEAPAKSASILKAVSSAVPQVEPFITSAVARNGSEPVNMATVLAQTQTQIAAVVREQMQEARRTETAASKPTLLAYAFQPPPPQPPPRVDPPLTPFIPGPNQIRISDTVIVTPGTVRDYSSP